MTENELIQFEMLSRKFSAVLTKRGAPRSVLRFTEDIERAVHWYAFNKEKNK